ncbi:MAG: class I SAM-dependent methyltransferase [Anaerolineales bacterium]|jgi:ubiquinone/menaquinone biosynthesis C-methylase UbiE
MTTEIELKQQVREFYNQVGWQEVSEGVYQNARYEDLRPVSREYIHRCHIRVIKHLEPEGRFFLDAGSGPIQYPEYLEYSRGYDFRVCVDISFVALLEARKRIGDHGLFVVADIAELPFKPAVFDGLVSLHTIHHLPQDEHALAFSELHRVLMPGRRGVVVNGWHNPPLGVILDQLRRFTLRLRGFIRRLLGLPPLDQPKRHKNTGSDAQDPKGTFVSKNNAAWLKQAVGSEIHIKILVWRSVSVKILRTFFHDGWGGRRLLRILFWLEECFPNFLGENGQYPLIVIHKV